MIKTYLGDCRDILPNILDTYKDKNIILVSDPPFNIGYKYNSYKDNLEEKEYLTFMASIFKDKPSVIIHYPETLYKIAFQMNKIPSRVLTWVYNSNTPRQHRDIAFFDIKPNLNQVKQPYKNLNDRRIRERMARGIEGGALYDWMYVDQVKNISKDKTLHPCQMPLKVMENIIGILPRDVLVIDPFAGSGQTGIACKNLDVDFIGIEIDKNYFDIMNEELSKDPLLNLKKDKRIKSLFIEEAYLKNENS